MGLYLAKSTVASAYGAASSLVIILTWVYYSAQIVLFGAEVTQVHSHQAVPGPKKAGLPYSGCRIAKLAILSRVPRGTSRCLGGSPTPA